MNFVLVHGAWHGGWCWRDVAKTLRSAGHEVYTPTMTGLGERAHLLNETVGLSTFIDDVSAVLVYEELEDVVLVGHSFGGVVISGVADRMKSRIKHLIYLDAVLVQQGRSALGALPPAVQKERSRTIDPEGLRMPIPPPNKFGVFDPDQIAWIMRHVTPHPLKSYTDGLTLQNPFGNGLPKTYIAVTDPAYEPLARVRDFVKTQDDWGWREIATGHDAMVTAPDTLAKLLMEIAA